MRCGVCHATLRVRGYRRVAISGGTRRVPLYHPCPNLADPSRHPARGRRHSGAVSEALTVLTPGISGAPFSRGTRLRFLGPGPFAARLAAGTEVVVTDTCGTRSLFALGEYSGAIWPEHAAHWQIIPITSLLSHEANH